MGSKGITQTKMEERDYTDEGSLSISQPSQATDESVKSLNVGFNLLFFKQNNP